MSIQVTIPDNDPMVKLLEERAMARGLGKDKKELRKKLPSLGRTLIKERLGDLKTAGDPFAVKTLAT